MSTVHADDDAGPGRSWTEMIRAGLRLVGVACCVANLLGGLGVALFLVDPTPASRLGLALVLAGQAAILLAVAGEHRSGWRTALVLALSFGGAALALPATTWTTGPAAWWPTQFVLTIVGYLVYVEPPGRRWYLVALVISANAWARVESWPRDAQRPDARLLPQLAFESTQAAVMAVTVYLTLSAVLAAAAQADAARTAARSRRQAEQRERAREARSREVDRFIHDEVLHALRSIALERDAVPAEQAAEHGRRLARLMSGMPDVPLPSPDSDQSKARRDLTATLQDVAGRSGLQVTVIGPRPLSVPPGVGQAFARAVEESLRNVARHAGTDRARVRLRRSGFTVSVIVTDEGVGFDPHAVDAERRGVSASIAQRMSDVRGSAHVDSEPGRGTIVTLRWRPRVEGGHPGEDGLAAGAIDRLAPAGVAAYLPFLLANPWLAFWMAPLLILPLAGWAGSVLAVTAGLAATAVGLRRGLRGWHSAVLSLVAWAASLANGLALPPGSTNPSLYWLAGGVSGILYLQVLLRPLREAVVTGLGLTAIALACALHALDGLSQLPLYLPALLSPALALVSAVLLGRTVDAMGWEVLRAEETAIEAAAGQRVSTEFEQQLRERMDRRREAVLDFVRAVAEGRLDVTDPQVQARAHELEHLLRDQLLQPPLEVQQAAHRLRESGIPVQVRAAPDLPSPVAEAMVQALDSLAAAQPWPVGTQVQATLAPSAASWRLALVISGAAPQLRSWTTAFARDEGWAPSEVHGGVHLVRRLAQPVPSLTDSP